MVDAKGLCDIIKACKSADVRRLSFGDVEVDFVGNGTQHPVSYEETPYRQPDLLGEKPVSMELATDQRRLLEEAEEAELQITDPVGWESSQIDLLVHGNRTAVNADR